MSKNLDCLYPASRGRSATQDSIGGEQHDNYTSNGASGLQPVGLDTGREPYDLSAYYPELQQAQGASLDNPSYNAQNRSHPADSGALANQPPSYNQIGPLYPPVVESVTIPATEWTTNVMSTINWLQPDAMNLNDDDLNSLFPFFPGDYTFSPSVDFISPTELQDDETPGNPPSSSIVNEQQTSQPERGMSNLQQHVSVIESSPAVDMSTVTSGEYYVDGDAGRLPRAKRRKIIARPRRFYPVEAPNFSLDVSFPITSCADSRLVLSDEKYGQLGALHAQLGRETSGFQAFGQSDFPQKPVLQWLLSNYFTQFDQTIPFLHFPTFRTESSHAALLLAMVALGSCFVDGEETEIFALSMHELVRRYLVLGEGQKQWRPESPQTLAQIQLLHAIGAGYTLWEPLYGSASKSLFSAVKFCRDTWSRKEETIDASDSESDNVSTDWAAWIRKEELNRTGFCIWLLDCMWAHQFHQPPHLSLDDAGARFLPCPERLWSARDVHEWARLRASGNTETPTLLDSLRNLYIDKRLLPNQGEFSRILLIHGLFHRTWEVRTTVTQSLSSFEPSEHRQDRSYTQPNSPIWPPSVPLFNKWRNSACDCLDILHWSANATIGLASGMEHPTVLHLHLARVVLLAPMNDIVRFSRHLIRSSKDSAHHFQPVSAAEAEEHRRLIQRWAIQDQYKARLAAIHAGVVFWHVRLYSINGFFEPTAVAFAALLLWALSAFSAKQSPSRQSPDEDKDKGKGTELPSAGSSPSPDVCDIILIDRPTDDELVQQFVRQGNNMHANMTGVGDLFGPKGPRKVLAEGQKLLLTLRSWRGVTEHWLKVLSRLEKVTAMLGVDTNTADINAPSE